MSGGDEGEAPNSRCGGSCPTASLLALLFPVPTFSPSTPWTTNEGEAPNNRCGGSCPTASLLALLFPFPTFSTPCFRFLYLYTLDYFLSGALRL